MKLLFKVENAFIFTWKFLCILLKNKKERFFSEYEKETKMKTVQHYIIGDVHGEYEMLLRLVAKLPSDARLIFVGDLVNRGRWSRQVVAYAKEHAFAVVRGNHEGYFIEHGKIFLEKIQANINAKPNLNSMWAYVGGVEMLHSYRLLTKCKENECHYVQNNEGMAQLAKDITWAESLPFYLELGELEGYEAPIVISHGSIGDFWHLREENPEHFEFYVQSNRRPPSSDAPIFNIYGHKNYPSVQIGTNYICVDTGCGKSDGVAKLSAYCLETKEVFEVKKSELMMQEEQREKKTLKYN